MFAVESVENVLTRTVMGRPQTDTSGAIVRASKTYRITNPHDIAAKLESRGYEAIKLTVPTVYHNKEDAGISRQGRRWIVEARYPGQSAVTLAGGEYQEWVKFLLDHSGREAFKVSSGAIRCACANQFYAAPIRILHVHAAIDRYLECPWEAAEVVRESGRVARDRLESLHETPDGALWDAFHALNKPRLFAAVARAYRQYENTAWGFLQALTHTKRPTCVTLAQLALTDEVFPTVLAGGAPDNWN